MAKQLKLRRGTTSQHSSFTGAEGEVTVDTTKDTLVVHDGSTAGGIPLAKEAGNITGSSATVTTAAQPNITSTGTLTGLTVSGDVHFDNGADAGKDILWDVSDDQLEFSDNVKASFGTDSDLRIYHDAGAHSYIANYTNQLYIMGQNNVYLQHHASGSAVEDMLIARGDGAVELYYDNAKKLETLSNGIEVTGHVRVQSSSSGYGTNLYDSVKSGWGNGQDLQISHDGTNSLIDNNTGNLKLQSVAGCTVEATYFNIYDEAGSETIAEFAADGACNLYFDNVKKFNTNSDGIYVTGDISFTGNLYGSDGDKIRLGSSQDLEISHDGSNSIIVNKTGRLIDYVATNEIAIDRNPNGSVDLYHDGTKKFETTSAGAQVTGNLRVDGMCDLYDDKYARFGDSADLSIYHNGTSSYIKNITGGLVLSTSDSGTVTIAGGENMAETLATFTDNGSVDLYYDNSKKFETTSSGATVTGNCTATSNFRGNDNVKVSLGDGEDLKIYHNGTVNVIDCASANNLDVKYGTEYIARFGPNGGCALYYDNSNKIETVTGGVTVTGVCTATSFAGSGANLTNLPGRDGTPGFSVTDSDGTTLSSGSWTAMTWDTEVWDSDNAFASSEFTVPSSEDGKYHISYSININDLDDQEQLQAAVYKDTGSGYAEVPASRIYMRSPQNGIEIGIAWSGVLDLDAGDKLKVYVYHNEGANNDIKSDGGTYKASFSGYRVN